MKRRVVTLAGAAGLVAIGVPALAHGTSDSMLNAINAHRTSAGIAAVSTRGDWNSACKNHDAYMGGNRVLTHAESSQNSLYTSTGAWAASHSIIAYDSSGFSDGGNPWADSPLHQFQALHPWLRTTGVDVSGRYACMITLAGRDGGITDDAKLVTWPGFGQTVPLSEQAAESPFVPGADVGLGAGRVTGPYLMVYALGPEHETTVVVRSATLTADDGSDVPVRWVDAKSAQSGPYLQGGAMVIPVSPLSEGVTYSLRVEVSATTDSGTNTVMSRTTSFTASATAKPTTSGGSANAASTQTAGNSGTNDDRITTIGSNNGGTLSVALGWDAGGTLQVRMHCASSTERCAGPLRILVNRKGHKTQKLRFVVHGGPLKVNLAPGRTIKRRVKMTKRQKASGSKRGFRIHWGGPVPVQAKALDYQ